jgi:acetoin utilization deacetylase AcuC-like enzyme
MNCHSETYRAMTRLLMGAANRLCENRLALIHEGGYNSTVTPFIGLAILETLAGISTNTPDPFVANVKKQPSEQLRANEDEVIRLAEANARLVPVAS